MFSIKIWIFQYKKVELKKKKLLLLFDFVSFFVFLSLCSIFLFCFLLCQAIFMWLASFLKRFFSFLRRAHRGTWKKSGSNNGYYKKAVVKVSRNSNSNSPPWNLVKFCSEFFLVNISRIMRWIVKFWLWINGKL